MILEQIVSSVRETLARRQSERTLSDLERAIAGQALPRDLARALKGQGIRLIAEVKRASPSKGLLCPNLDVSALARTYSQAGAAAISVLTEGRHFRGSLADLAAVWRAVDLPLLDKDFIVSPYQVYEARAYGADAVLLIAAILSQAEMKGLLKTIHQLGMTALVEVHDVGELGRVLALNPRVVGINNRHLGDFSVDLETTFRLRALIPEGTLVVSESGIHTWEEVERLEAAGVDAVLIGEALVTSPDPGLKVAQLVGRFKA